METTLKVFVPRPSLKRWYLGLAVPDTVSVLINEIGMREVVSASVHVVMLIVYQVFHYLYAAVC